MRTLFILLALAVCFLIWDHIANYGIYTSDLQHSFREAAVDLKGG